MELRKKTKIRCVSEVYALMFPGGCVRMRLQFPSTSVTTLLVTSVKAPACWLEQASLKRKKTSDGKFSWS